MKGKNPEVKTQRTGSRIIKLKEIVKRDGGTYLS